MTPFNLPWWAITIFFTILLLSWLTFILIQYDATQSRKAYDQLSGQKAKLTNTKTLIFAQTLYTVMGIILSLGFFITYLGIF